MWAGQPVPGSKNGRTNLHPLARNVKLIVKGLTRRETIVIVLPTMQSGLGILGFLTRAAQNNTTRASKM